jgi:3-hydroxyacyl-CoA dehydrogenase
VLLLLLLLQIDAAIAGGFGMPMGPFRLSDLVGR